MTGFALSRLLQGCTLAMCVALASCASQQDIVAAINSVNKVFQADYEAVLVDKGVRAYMVRKGDAFAAVQAAMSRLGMQISDRDADIGTLTAFATAPRPLDAQEWRQAASVDLPRMRQIARPHIGLMAEMISFEPEGLEIVINAVVLDVNGASEVSLTTRMREIAPPRSNMPRREYPPPTAVALALDKIWRQFEQELRQARKIP